MSAPLNPKVSVVMPVYNAAPYLRDAIDSILAQTFGDFEFIIIDDCSTDDSYAIARSYDDPRIALYRNEQNCGVTRTLNRGLDLAHGEYIARMDADDISLPQRFALQIDYLTSNSHIDFLATNCRFIDSQGQPIRDYLYNTKEIPTSNVLKWFFLWGGNRIAHPTIMMRHQTVKIHHLYYDIDYPFAQDYELWTRAVQLCNIAVIPDICLLHREHSGSVSHEYRQMQDDTVNRVMLRELSVLPSQQVSAIVTRILRSHPNEEQSIDRKDYIYTGKIIVSTLKTFLFSNSITKDEEDQIRVHAADLLRRVAHSAAPYSRSAALRSLLMIRKVSLQVFLSEKTAKQVLKLSIRGTF